MAGEEGGGDSLDTSPPPYKGISAKSQVVPNNAMEAYSSARS